MTKKTNVPDEGHQARELMQTIRGGGYSVVNLDHQLMEAEKAHAHAMKALTEADKQLTQARARVAAYDVVYPRANPDDVEDNRPRVGATILDDQR